MLFNDFFQILDERAMFHKKLEDPETADPLMFHDHELIAKYDRNDR